MKNFGARVMTKSVQYCHNLSRDVLGLPSLPDTVESNMGHYRDSPGLSQVLVRENTHIPQYLVSQDTQDILGISRTVPGSPTILGKVQSGIKPHGTKFPAGYQGQS